MTAWRPEAAEPDAEHPSSPTARIRVGGGDLTLTQRQPFTLAP